MYPDVTPLEDQEITITRGSFREHPSEAVCDNNRCLSDGMGSSLGRQVYQRFLGTSLDSGAHQCVGAQGSLPLSEGFSPVIAKQTCFGKDGQYVRSVSHQSPGWHQVSTMSPGDKETAFLELLSLKAVYIPGVANKAADLLSRTGPLPGEWHLHPEVVKLIWGQFGMAKIDLFAMAETAHCNLWFSLNSQGDPLGIDALKNGRKSCCMLFLLYL